MSKKVKLELGYLPQESLSSSENVVEKRALLVYVGKFESATGPVEITAAHLRRTALNHNSLIAKFKRLATGDVNPKIYPPIQLDHSSSADKTVGRLVGDVELGEYTNEHGKTVLGLYGTVRIMGRENVEKVNDGRWTHLSVGLDLEEGKFNEVTVTPFPAAAGASFLSAMKDDEQTADSEAEKKKLSKEDGDVSDDKDKDKDKEMKAKVKAKMMKDGMNEEDADKKLSEMADEEMKKLGAKCSEEDEEAEKKKKEDDEEKEKDSKKKEELARLTAVKETFAKLTTNFEEKRGHARLAAKKVQIKAKLSALRMSAKITPAEIKKIEVDKLATQSEATIAAVLSSYDAREPVIPVGVFGNAKAANIATLSKQIQLTSLEKETRANMSSVRNTENGKDADVEKQKETVTLSADQSSLDAMYTEMKKLILAKNDDTAKALLSRFLVSKQEDVEPVGTENVEKHIEEMSAEFDSVVKLFSENLK